MDKREFLFDDKRTGSFRVSNLVYDINMRDPCVFVNKNK